MEQQPQHWSKVIPPEDVPVVVQLREMLEKDNLKLGKHDHDVFLARFSRARKRNAKDAYEMLKKCLAWRQEKKVDTINDWFEPSEEHKRFHAYYPFAGSDEYGFGKMGRPVNFDHYPLIDPDTVLQSFERDTLVVSHIWQMERCLDWAAQSSDKEGRPITDQVFVFNMQGMALRHLRGDVVDMIKQCFAIDENYYPEVVACAVVINAPRVFTLLFKVLSPFVDPKTLEKTRVIGSDFMPELLQWMEPENIPSQWGGKGPAWTKFAGYAVTSTGGKGETESTMTVAAGATSNIAIDVEEDGSHIWYQFSTVDYDIQFGVTRESDGAIIIKTQRHNSHVDIVQGKLKNVKKGKYLLHFDNTYSWTTPKTVSVVAGVSKKQKKNKKKKK